MRYYAEGIRKAQKELRLDVESFPNLGLNGTDEDDRRPLRTFKKPHMTTKVQRREGGEIGSMLSIKREMSVDNDWLIYLTNSKLT